MPVDAEGALGKVSFLKIFEVFPLSTSVDSSTDFSQFQGIFCGVEPRWKANCQRQWGQHHQDLGLAVWRLPVDADRAFERVSFFSHFSSLPLLIRVLTFPDCRVFSVGWSPDGKQIASGSGDNTIKIWDSHSGDCQSTLTGHSNL